MDKESILYLSIYEGLVFLGFIILALESIGTVELRRIVVTAESIGIS
jgi:hypothetical protein